MKKITLFIFSLVISFVLFCGLSAQADGTLSMVDGAQIRTEGEFQGLRFQASATSLDGTDEHGFYLAAGEHTLDAMRTAIEAGEATVGGRKLVKRSSTGEDLEFAVTVYGMDEASEYAQVITAVAYIKTGASFTFDKAVTRNIAEGVRELYNASETPAEIVATVAAATRVKVTGSDSSVAYYDEISDVTLAAGDTVDLLRGTYNDALVIEVANVTVNGTNKDKSLNADGTRVSGTFETILNNSVLLYTGANTCTINGLTIKGSLMDDGNPAAKSWRESSQVDETDSTRLAASASQYGAGIVVFDSHNDVTIKCNKFAMIEGSTYAIVDSCKDNVTVEAEVVTEYKLNSNRQKNMTITNNYFDFSAQTAYSCDIFFRGYVYNSTISSNYFKNNYTTGSDTFSYDHCIRLWRIGNSSTSNTTLTISNNTFAHTKTNIAIDLGFAANAVKTTQTINIQRNVYGDYTRRGVRVCNVKDGETINITGNDMTISDKSTANYAVLLSGGTTKSSESAKLPNVNIKNNAFNGVVKLQFGFAAATNFAIDHNYYEGGSATFDGTVTTSILEDASVDPNADKYATYEAWEDAQ